MRRYIKPAVTTTESTKTLKAETINHPNIDDYMKRERGTATQTKFKELLIERLQAMNFIGEVLCDPVYVIPIENGRYRLRKPDFAIVSIGLVIDCDGAIHDISAAKARKDCTREDDWRVLGYDCYRFGNEQIHDLRSCSTVLNEIEALIRKRQSNLNGRKESSARTTRAWRARKQFNECFPQEGLHLGRARTGKPQPSEFAGISSCKTWGGLTYCFFGNRKR